MESLDIALKGIKAVFIYNKLKEGVPKSNGISEKIIYILSQRLVFYVKPRYGKVSCFLWMAAYLNIAKQWWKHQHLRLIPSIF